MNGCVCSLVILVVLCVRVPLSKICVSGAPTESYLRRPNLYMYMYMYFEVVHMCKCS